jgi:hypothetical protein
MARIIEEFPPEWRARRYPWREWLDGKPRVLTQGEDFTVSLIAIQRHFVRMARERGLQGYTRVISPTEIAVQAVALDAQGEAGSRAVGRLADAPGRSAGHGRTGTELSCGQIGCPATRQTAQTALQVGRTCVRCVADQ